MAEDLCLVPGHQTACEDGAQMPALLQGTKSWTNDLNRSESETKVFHTLNLYSRSNPFFTPFYTFFQTHAKENNHI